MSLMDAGDGSSPKGLTLHVLCPSLPSPNRFTFNDLPLSITVADLKDRISQSVPSRPTPGSQRLLYLGKQLSDDAVTLQSLFEPLNASEVSMHLVLPPSPPQPTDSARQAENAPHSTFNADAHRINRQRHHLLHAQRLRYRAPNPLRPDEIAQSLHENARRRLAEIQQLQQGGALPRPQWTRPPVWPPSQQLPHPPSYMPGPPGMVMPTAAPFATLPNLSAMDFGEGLQLPEEAQARLRLLKQYISLAEEQLNCRIAPTIDHIIQLRSHLFKLLDDQLRRPASERGEYIEPLIARVFDISARADELRQPRLLPIQNGSSQGLPAPLYLVCSPSGYQAVCTSSVAANAARTVGTTGTLGVTSPAESQQPNAQPNAAEAAVLENVVRQAVLNQRPVPNGQFGLGRNLRRLWLFMRLYFFCHMFSEPGSQARLLYVTLAAIAAILSETSIPRRVYRMILVPVQRHLEGLVHFTPGEQAPPRPQGTGAAGDDATANQQVGVRPGREANWAGGVFHNLRRVERSAALFIASLVPGVGERHIEVRNAAEAARNAEITRREEERRRQEEESAAEATAQERPPGVDGEASDSERDTQTNTGVEAPNEHQSAIPQEAH
ncbi:hypothetical protein BJX76DRAFT_150016 [Aspergillus varians]